MGRELAKKREGGAQPGQGESEELVECPQPSDRELFLLPSEKTLTSLMCGRDPTQ